MQILLALTMGLAVGGLTATRSTAQEGPPQAVFSLSLGGGGLVAPDYPGSDRYGFQPVPALDASYADKVLLSVQDGLGQTS
jgi:outer membrane scaffolding protein for murein synthesis (MipA/OmpV family)